jgi:hypothetical protein
MGGSKRLTVEAEDVRHLQHATLECGDELVDGQGNRLDDLRCQMGIDGRGSGRSVTENTLDDAQIDPGFQQVGGVAVTQRVPTLLTRFLRSKFITGIIPFMARR